MHYSEASVLVKLYIEERFSEDTLNPDPYLKINGYVTQVPDSNENNVYYQTVARIVSATTHSVKALFLLT